MDANLIRRVGFAAVAIPLALLLVWFGGLPLALLLAAAGAISTRELYHLAERRQVRPLVPLGVATSAAIAPVTWAALSTERGPALLAAAPYAAALWLLLLLTWTLATRTPAERPLEAAGVTWLAVGYAGALPAFVLVIRHGQYPLQSWAGAWLVFFPLVVTWVCDTAAMFGGRTFGGPRLAPTVSPGKTRSGTVTGIVGGLLVAPVFGLWVFPAVGVNLTGWELLAIAGVLSIVGQVGDLAESLFKREAGVKDASNLIPGHGGALDRLDSLYFVVPVAAAMYRALGVI